MTALPEIERLEIELSVADLLVRAFEEAER
jgi:hypothetical protein